MVSALEAGLAEWYEALKPLIWFDSNIDIDAFHEHGLLPNEIDGNIAWLRSSHASCPAIYFWPAAQEAASSSSPVVPKDYCDAVVKFCKSAMRYIASASQMVNGRFSPQAWPQAMGFLSSS